MVQLFIIAELGNKENCNMFYILSSGDMLSNFANRLYPDQVRQYIGRDSNPNCLAFRLHFRKGYFNHVRIDSSRKKKEFVEFWICSDFIEYAPCLYEDVISIFTMGNSWPLLMNNVFGVYQIV